MGGKKGKETNYAVGIDLSEFSIKVAVLEETEGKQTLKKAACFENPEKKIDPTSLELIPKFLEDLPRRQTTYRASIVGPQVVVRRLTLPKMAEQELLPAARWGVRETVPFSLDGAKVDCVVLGDIHERGMVKSDVLVMVAGQEALQGVEGLLTKSEMAVDSLMVPAFAAWPLVDLQLAKEPHDVVAFLDVGEESTLVHIFRKGKLEFTRNITMGGRALTEAVTQAILPGQNRIIAVDEAEEIKQKHGIPSFESQEVTHKDISLRKVSEMMRPVLERMRNEIQRSLDYFNEKFREEKIERVYLLGGGSLLTGFDSFLTDGLGIPVNPVDFRQLVDVDPKVFEDRTVDASLTRFGVAIGLALAPPDRMNFLRKPKPKWGIHVTLKERLQFVKLPKIEMRYVVLFLALIFLLVTGTTIRLYQVAGALQQEVSEKDVILQDVRVLHQKKSILRKLNDEQPLIQEMLSTLTRLLPEPMVLSELTYVRETAEVTVKGLGRNEKEISHFYHAVVNNGLFDHVILKEIKKEGKREKLPYAFDFHFGLATL